MKQFFVCGRELISANMYQLLSSQQSSVQKYKWTNKSYKRTHVSSSQCNYFSVCDGMSEYFGIYCCLQAIRRSFANVGCISLVLSRETNMWPASWGLNIFKSVVEVRFGYPLPRKWAGQRSWYSDWLRAGQSGDRIPVGGETFRTCPDRLWGPPSLLYNGYRVFPGDKDHPGRDFDPSPLLVPWS